MTRIAREHAGLTVSLLLSLVATRALAQEEEPQGTEDRQESVQEEVAVDTTAADLARPPSGVIGALRLYGGVHLAFGGELEQDPAGSGPTFNDDLLATVGLQAGVDYVIIKYFALAGEVRLLWFNSESADDNGTGRSMLVDIDVKPRARYMLDARPLELYAALPVGLTLPKLDSDYDVDTKAGWNIGLALGANYFFTNRFGANLEAAWIAHYFSATTEVGDVELDISMSQFSVILNGVFAM